MVRAVSTSVATRELELDGLELCFGVQS